MAEINRNQEKEAALKSKVFQQWKGVFTQNSRVSIPADNFYNLSNLQPIGAANLHTINGISTQLVDYGIDLIYWSVYVNLLGTNYLINFASDGKVFAYNIDAQTSAQINIGLPLSGLGSRATQWKNSQVLIIDSTGYYHWDGTTFAQITGTGVPTAGNDIAVYSGRVWIFNARLLVVSAADDYTAAAFLATNGAIAINLTDPTLRGVVTRAIAANGYLYFTGASSVNVISNVYIPAGASPPAPLLTNTNIQSLLGSDQAGSFFVIGDRDLFFANSYGVHRLRGVSADRVSADIDGTWQYRDTTLPVSGGGVLSNNILNAAVLLKTTANPIDPVFATPQTILAMFSDEKWWFVNYGALTLVTGALVANVPALFGFIGNKLFQLFQSTTSSPVFSASTALWALDDPIANKQAIRAGVEMTITTLFSKITISVDTPQSSSPLTQYAPFTPVQWINASGAVVTWLNVSALPVEWFSGGFLLVWGDGEGYSRYLGLTVTGQGQGQLSGFFMDYKVRNRWGGGLQ